MQFSQLQPEEIASSIPAVRKTLESQKRNLENLPDQDREALILLTTRTILFQSFNGAVIDRKKLSDVVLKSYKSDDGGRVPSVMEALVEEASNRLEAIYGFSVCAIPEFMQEDKTIPNRFKDRLYVVNRIADVDGRHCNALHGNHDPSERGLLIMILAFIWCKGASIKGGTRWISTEALHHLLHSCDPHFPDEPRPKTSKREVLIDGFNKDFDSLLDQYTSQDYLISQKFQPDQNSNVAIEECGLRFAMGPRSVLEIGRKQLIQIISEIADEEVDAAMLAEIDGYGDDDEEE